MSLLQVKNLTKKFLHKKKIFTAVNDVSFTLAHKSSLAIIGESGSGKTTLAHLILHLIKPSSGQILWEGKSLEKASFLQSQQFRKKVQVVFQNPFTSFNPKKTVKQVLEEPFQIHKIPYNMATIDNLLDIVALPKSSKMQLPSQLSGGQRQRLSIARALSLRPSCLVCDEALSALDISIQAQILELLSSLQKQYELSYLFITHRLAEATYLAQDVIVMKEGKILEQGRTQKIFSSPQTNYTQQLLEACKYLSI